MYWRRPGQPRNASSYRISGAARCLTERDPGWGTASMKSLIVLVSLLMTGVCFAAETYKWVDDKGVVNYGEKPPANRRAQPVDTNPRTVIETGGQFSQKPEVERRRNAEDFQRPQAAVAPAEASYPVRGMEF